MPRRAPRSDEPMQIHARYGPEGRHWARATGRARNRAAGPPGRPRSPGGRQGVRGLPQRLTARLGEPEGPAGPEASQWKATNSGNASRGPARQSQSGQGLLASSGSTTVSSGFSSNGGPAPSSAPTYLVLPRRCACVRGRHDFRSQELQAAVSALAACRRGRRRCTSRSRGESCRDPRRPSGWGRRADGGRRPRPGPGKPPGGETSAER